MKKKAESPPQPETTKRALERIADEVSSAECDAAGGPMSRADEDKWILLREIRRLQKIIARTEAERLSTAARELLARAEERSLAIGWPEDL